MHTERAQLSLTKLSEKDAAFASWAMWCNHRDSDEPVAPAWTNGKDIFYGIDFEAFTPDEKMAVSAHEIFHVAFRHPARGAALYRRLGNEYKHKTFNIAIDAIVNETLKAAGYKLPKSAIFLTDVLDKFLGIKATPEEAISEWDSEKLYMALIKTKVSQKPPSPSNCKGKPSPSQKGGNSKPGDGEEDEEGGKGDKSKGKGKKDPTDPSNGGQEYDPTVSEALEEWADGMGYKGDLDEESVINGSASGADDEMEESEWAQRVSRGLAQGKLAGTGIGKLGFKIADVPVSRTPWEQILRQLVTKAVTRQMQPSYMRPTKNFLAMDSHAMIHNAMRPVYEQGWIKHKGVPRVVVGVDVSGSVDNRTLRIFAGEIAAIGKRTGSEIHVMVFDTQVLSHTKMAGNNWDTEITQLEFARGGGTDFKPVIAAAQKLEPSIIVILTDLYADFGEAPKCKVVWAVEEENGVVPPYGRVITMNR